MNRRSNKPKFNRTYRQKVWIDLPHHARLAELAQLTHRTYGAVVEWLIDQELQRRRKEAQ